MTQPPPPLPVILLTGFLGSGKTTLLNQLLNDESMADTAVIINEFGEIGIDHLLVEKVDDGIIEMSSGCLCCTIRGDLVNTLEDLLRRLDNGRVAPFSRVLIESTGLADPAPILHTIMSHPYLVMRYRLGAVVACIDAVNGMHTLDEHEESVKQAAVADRLVLTKTDLPESQNTLTTLISRLDTLNPAAALIDMKRAPAGPDELLEAGLYDPDTKIPDVARWLNEQAYADAHRHSHDQDHGHHHDPNRHDAHIHAFCIIHDDLIGESGFQIFLQLLQAQYGAQLLRLKGIIGLREAPETPYVIHGVQHIMHPPSRLATWPDDDRRSRLVFIMRDVEEDFIRKMFLGCIAPLSAEDAALVAEADNPLALGPGRGSLNDL